MKKVFSYIIGIICFIPATKTLAQADINMTTQWYNRAVYNPAFIARPDFAYIFSNARNQWVGVDGSPKVYTFQASEYISNLHSAIGLSFLNDQIGASQVLNPMLTYAYLLTDKESWTLSMGLSGGIFSRTINGSLYEAVDIIDPSVYYTSEKVLHPDANAGVEFQSTSFTIGLSSTHLFSINKEYNSYLNTNHRYGYFIYKNNNSEDYYYKLGLLMVNRYNLTVLEGNAFIRFKHATGLQKGPREIFDLGMSYRSSRQMTFLIGVLITPDLRIGYSYDQSFIAGYYPSGSHEILLEYRILNKIASTHPKCGEEIHWKK